VTAPRPIDLRLQRHAAGYFLAKLVPAVTALATIPVLTRLLSQADYGIFVLVSTATFTVAQTISQWLQQAVLRFLPGRADAGDADAIDSGTAAGLLLIALGACASFLPVIVVARAVRGAQDPLASYLGAALLLVIATMIFGTLQVYFTAQLTPARYALHTGFNAVLRLALPVAAVVVFRAGAQAALLAVACSYLLWSIPMAIELRMPRALLQGLRNTPRTVAWLRQAFHYGGPMAGWFASQQVLTLADRFLLTIFAGPAVAGLYVATYDLFNRGLILIEEAVALAVRPLVMQAANAGQPLRVIGHLRRGIQIFLLLAVPVVLASLIWRMPIAELLLPRDYWPGARIVPFILPAFLGWHLASFLQQLLEARRQTGRIFVAAGSAAALNVLLNVLLIPRFGYMAAALTTLLCFLAFLAGIVAFCPDAANVIPWKSAGRLLIAAGVMAAILLLAHVAPPARSHLARLAGYGGASLIAFVLVLAALGEFPREGLRQLRAMALKP
jgi:O-antigen/teichoic acid export membrane protein